MSINYTTKDLSKMAAKAWKGIQLANEGLEATPRKVETLVRVMPENTFLVISYIDGHGFSMDHHIIL